MSIISTWYIIFYIITLTIFIYYTFINRKTSIIIEYTCPSNITSFSQCIFPEGVANVYCRNNQIESFEHLPGSVSYISCGNNQINSFKYLPDTVSRIDCDNNQIKSFKYLPESIREIWCEYNQIKSFKYLPGSVTNIDCENNQINSFQYLPGSVTDIYCGYNQINSLKYLPGSVRKIICYNNQIDSFQYLPRSVHVINCENNPCNEEFILKGLNQIHQENEDRIISDFQYGISKLRYMQLNYMLHNIWKRYWYENRDSQGYSRACRHLASKNCPNGFLIMK